MIRVVATSTVVLCVVLTGAAAAAGAALGDVNGAARGAFTKPVSGARITQGFGCTPYVMEPYDAACATHHFHSGVDLAAALGTPVHATLGGSVTVILSATGYGLHIVIDHGAGLSSLYGHLSAVNVQSGDDVVSGEVIGAVGSTGNSTGPHLHFEIRRDGIPEDPLQDLSLP